MNTHVIINGENIQGSAETFKVLNPANEEVITEIASATPEQVNQAVQAATEAFKQWKIFLIRKLITVLVKLRMISVRKKEIARLITLEQGKPLEAGRV